MKKLNLLKKFNIENYKPVNNMINMIPENIEELRNKNFNVNEI